MPRLPSSLSRKDGFPVDIAIFDINLDQLVHHILVQSKKIPVRMIADQGQAANAAKILDPLLQKGMILKTIVGPDVILHQQPWSHGSFMHEKVMIFDGMLADALAKMGDSLNISVNALEHNFENQEFWQGFHAAFMQAHFNWLWDLAKPHLDQPANQASADVTADSTNPSDLVMPAKS